MRDMFGNETSANQAQANVKRKDPTPKGYAALPGTGPTGETCKTCAHIYRRELSKTYPKCILMKAHWTGGRGSDILVNAPACRRWGPSW